MTETLTVELPGETVELAKRYAEQHQLTLSELIDRSLRRLERPPRRELHPAIERMSGLVPGEVDARAEYAEHLTTKPG